MACAELWSPFAAQCGLFITVNMGPGFAAFTQKCAKSGGSAGAGTGTGFYAMSAIDVLGSPVEFSKYQGMVTFTRWLSTRRPSEA